MTKQQKEAYQDVAVLKKIIQDLSGQKFKLDCGHHTTLCHHFGNDITIINDSKPIIICSLCGH
ncbi:MAG: hypothetical protein KKE62_06360 [Proteobacteria bacterium]|nr:hypothetical protein [Pseudomonadota bacterium]MBU1542452.1 hypothetical protein [Pseudomonadota bacterium]